MLKRGGWGRGGGDWLPTSEGLGRGMAWSCLSRPPACPAPACWLTLLPAARAGLQTIQNLRNNVYYWTSELETTWRFVVIAGAAWGASCSQRGAGLAAGAAAQHATVGPAHLGSEPPEWFGTPLPAPSPTLKKTPSGCPALALVAPCHSGVWSHHPVHLFGRLPGGVDGLAQAGLPLRHPALAGGRHTHVCGHRWAGLAGQRSALATAQRVRSSTRHCLHSGLSCPEPHQPALIPPLLPLLPAPCHPPAPFTQASSRVPTRSAPTRASTPRPLRCAW